VYVLRSGCRRPVVMYSWWMPKLWTETIEAHRREVSDAICETAAALVRQHGLRAVTMSQIAEQTGIGRATLYKYFPDVDAILQAWHERHVADHLEQLAHARDQAVDAGSRLVAVLRTYAWITSQSHDQPDTELSAQLHRGDHVAHAQHYLHGMIRDLLADAVQVGRVRSDIAPDELASFCLHALAGARGLSSKAAVHRLVELVMAGLQPSVSRSGEARFEPETLTRGRARSHLPDEFERAGA